MIMEEYPLIVCGQFTIGDRVVDVIKMPPQGSYRLVVEILSGAAADASICDLDQHVLKGEYDLTDKEIDKLMKAAEMRPVRDCRTHIAFVRNKIHRVSICSLVQNDEGWTRAVTDKFSRSLWSPEIRLLVPRPRKIRGC